MTSSKRTFTERNFTRVPIILQLWRLWQISCLCLHGQATSQTVWSRMRGIFKIDRCGEIYPRHKIEKDWENSRFTQHCVCVTKCAKCLKSLSTGCIARCSSKESSKNWMCINLNFFWKASFSEVHVKLCLHKHHLRLCSQKYEISKLYEIKTALERQILEMLTTNIKRTFQGASKDNLVWLRNELEKGLTSKPHRNIIIPSS